MAKKRLGRGLESLLSGSSASRAEPIHEADSDGPVEDTQTLVENEKAISAERGADDGSDNGPDKGPDKGSDNGPGEHDTESADVAGTGSGVSDNTRDSTFSSAASLSDADKVVVSGKDQLVQIEIEKIRRGEYQPRRLFDQSLLQELANSIRSEGLIQPIIVRPAGEAYELVAGERRWRAAQLAGLDRLPAIIREMPAQSVAAVALIENIQRKDLNPLEEATALERLCDEFGMTHKAVAESVGRSRAAVSNLLRLLELDDEVKAMIDRAELEMGHARALLGVPTTRQGDIARRIVRQGMSVRAVEQYIRSLDANGNEQPANPADVGADPDIERLRRKLSETLGASVKIQHQQNGGGKLQISYSSVSELQGILAHIK